MNHADVELPPRIAALERDTRGYPVPYIVLRDREGTPIFTANDVIRVFQAIKEGLCHICGQELDDYPWFVGGPGSAYLNGPVAVYADGPMHHECMEFALKVCPHLLGRMTKSVSPIYAEKLHAQGIQTFDNTMLPGTPEVFVALQAFEFKPSRAGGTVQYVVDKPVRKTEFWRAGELMPKKEGEKTAKRAAKKILEGLDT